MKVLTPGIKAKRQKFEGFQFYCKIIFNDDTSTDAYIKCSTREKFENWFKKKCEGKKIFEIHNWMDKEQYDRESEILDELLEGI